MFSSSKSIAVIGLGAFGIALAREAKEHGARVTGVDTNQHRVDRYHAELDDTIRADATDERALRECAIDDHDIVVIAIGSNIEASLLAARNAKTLGAKVLHAKAQSEAQKEILKAIGVDRIVMPEIEGGRAFADTCLSDETR